MLLIALTFLFVNFAIGIGFQATTEGIGLSPISYQCHTGPQYIFPYTVTIFFLFVLSPFMVYQLKGISDGFGIRNELIFLSAFSAPCFTAYFLVPAIADDFSERFVDKTTWMALILIAGHINSIMIPISRYFKTHPHQCAYKAWVSQRKIERERETQQRTVAQVSAISEDGTEVTLPTHMPISRVDSNGDKSDLRDQEMAMEEFGSDYHSRKGSITNINNTIKNLARNQRKQGFRVGVGNSQGGTFDSKRVDWDEFIRVLEDRRLFDRLSAFTVREFCAENTRFLYEVTRLERRAIQYERLRNLSSTPVIASTTTPEQRLFPHTTQLSKSPSTSTTHSTTHSTLGPLPTQLTYAESQHRIKKIVSASSVGSSAPMLRTRRSSLSYVDDSEPSSPMASSSMSTFMRYGPTSALPDLEEGLVANKAEGSSAKSKSEVKLEVVEMVSHDITPFPMPPTLLIQFEYVYTTFISVGGRLELNLSHSTVQDIHRKARQANWSSGMFDGAVYEIQELLFRDVWPKFVTSSHGLNSNLPQSSDAASQNSRRLGYGGGAQAAESASTVYMPFEQHQSSTQQRFSPQPQRQPQAVSTRSTPSPSVHMVSPKSSMSAATSSRAVGSLSDSGSIGPAGSVKSWRDDEFQEEPSRSGFRTWLSKKSRTGITAAVLMSREGSNDESLGIIEQSRKSTAADRRNGWSSVSRFNIQPSAKTIALFGQDATEHRVRLYYLPTPNTNGFTTTHTLIRRNSCLSRGSGADLGEYTDTIVKDIPDEACHLTRVSQSERGIVHLARLSITSFIIPTSSIHRLTHLVSLRLQGNRLKDLPPQIFRLASLRELDVSQNLLEHLSGLVGLLAPTLEELFLQSNRLEFLPQQLGMLKRLRLLDIADNWLGCISVEVQRLVSETPATERPSFWRAGDQSTPTPNHGENNDTADGISTPTSPLGHTSAPQHQVAPAHEDGGHDDDDYVQIRQGMKCWARGNRFWQVGVPWSSTLSPPPPPPPPHAIKTASTSLSTYPAPTAVSTFASHPRSPHLYSPASPSSSNTDSKRSRTTSQDSSIGIGVSWYRSPGTSENLPLGSGSRYHHHQHPQIGASSRQSSGSQVDQKQYSKDSYSSCAWTLSLSDICSQIVGQQLFKDPHFYCTRSCYIKRRRDSRMARCAEGVSMKDFEQDDLDDCMVLMMPDWTIDQLGLYHLAELRKTAHNGWSDVLEAAEQTPKSAPTSSLLKIPAPSSPTLEEGEMLLERCSVCQTRLFFSGMRWKGIGVLDERIVPLEWVACSVQCRGRVESEERGQGGFPKTADRHRSRSQSQESMMSQTSDSSGGSFGRVVDLGVGERVYTAGPSTTSAGTQAQASPPAAEGSGPTSTDDGASALMNPGHIPTRTNASSNL
ncbi:hypothetical protein BG004_000503 [Podila humilis]|nr:hypothetical protein BG004_000503 [Podila humilis]